ncbi:MULTISPECIES: hypothetical protein [unclassified Prochlorococcus]|uniref:hypothetical protein n=1 Tax=unclassified Prochlorococcus TaxID=2627481 RepID=UPI000533B0B3|nr:MULTISPECIES: hypothetical protein [unclassified Prochlorococcus]KGG26546.1 hypothetical protein EV12_1635 [Prochlorococcus sp. MIT 0701]KGG30101.1 hypothetical protein EV13_0432 [Prochlorococcus sp. MIT 0702]KGG33242.1 hypothetical protein EV14_1713 [Prochlorococcus sp. MIT 0703]
MQHSVRPSLTPTGTAALALAQPPMQPVSARGDGSAMLSETAKASPKACNTDD